MTPLTFSHSGGDILWRHTPIQHFQAEALATEYRAEITCARMAGDRDMAAFAAKLLAEINAAIDAADDWRRAANLQRRIA